MELLIKNDAQHDNRSWGAVDVDDGAPPPHPEQEGDQSAVNSGSVLDELQSQGFVFGIDAVTDSPL